MCGGTTRRPRGHLLVAIRCTSTNATALTTVTATTPATTTVRRNGVIDNATSKGTSIILLVVRDRQLLRGPSTAVAVTSKTLPAGFIIHFSITTSRCCHIYT